jgi:hypothetical protein
MFACQNFLKQSCSKFYKEQKLFYGHIKKMTKTCPKRAHKEELGAVLTLSKILPSPSATSLSEGFWKLYIFSSRLIWLLLQLTNM